ncbi:hypothetical protein [Geothrix oryzisoli]|uniref:hypothetical protein n=1 Tax=Geothrix oryzisoli TaxID=2922721 RepID=UPI001FACC281|nr:hypothetical protein [Geothrix oryzisoli]
MHNLKYAGKRLAKPSRHWVFTNPEVRHSIHFKADKKWELTGHDAKGLKILLPMPAGEFTLDFPVQSLNLAEMIIDPDPGGGTVIP